MYNSNKRRDCEKKEYCFDSLSMQFLCDINVNYILLKIDINSR